MPAVNGGFAPLTEDVEAKLGHFQRSYSTPLTAEPSIDSLGSGKEHLGLGAPQLPFSHGLILAVM